MAEKRKKSLKASLRWVIGAALLVAAGSILTLWAIYGTKEPPQKEILTKAVLEEIVQISEVSTYEAVYNGIAKVMNEKKPDKLDYYVSYEAKVKAGFDFEKIRVTLRAEEKEILVTLPPVGIIDVWVDPASLDYMFQNEKANASSVTEQAYKASKADAKAESEEQQAIYTLAQQSAENFVGALIRPFVKQLDPEYIIKIQWEGQA